MKQSLVVLVLAFFIPVSCLWWLTGSPLNSYLSMHHPVDEADILLVEGWLSNVEFVKVAKMNTDGHYKWIVTTGTSSTDEYKMGRNGSLNFYINPPVISNSSVALTIFARGNFPDKDASIFEVSANDSIVGTDFASRKSSAFTFDIPSIGPIQKISVRFLNNAVINGKARNLYVSSISLNNYYYSAFDTNVYFWVMTSQDSSIFRSARCKADEASYYLEQSGIDSTKIITICTEEVAFSRTFSTACNTMEQLDSIFVNNSNHNMNVVSIPPHTRRTYLAYKKAAPHWNIGIISLGNESEKNKKYNRLRNIQELTGIMLIKILRPEKQGVK